MALFKRELSEASQQILKKSVDFETTVVTMVKRSERRAWIVAMCSMGVTVCLVAGIAYMLPLKEKIPYLVTVDLKRSTSTVSPLRDNVAATGIYASEALNRSQVARFVQSREGYDYDTINEHDWEYVASMSNDQVKGLFVKQFDGTPNSPEKRWGRDNAIRIKVNSIVFNGLDEERGARPTGATVRFEKWKFDKKTGKSTYLSSHVATLRYEFKANLKMSDELRLRNPLGFQVTAYKVDDEFNAPVFKQGTGARKRA
jgi:type IV secretion system protein VirB8